MARRRMFSLDVVDTDRYLDLSVSVQALYFHLGMRADDDGFVSSPKRIASLIGASADDLKLLIEKGFIIAFDSGVCAIREWRVNNYIQNDRYTPTRYQAELSSLRVSNGVYELPDWKDNTCIQTVSKLDTQDRLGKDRIEKNIYTDKKQDARFVPPTVEEVKAYCAKRGNNVDPENFVDFYTAKGWVVGKAKMKDWKAAVRTWERRDNRSAPQITDPDKNLEQW